MYVRKDKNVATKLKRWALRLLVIVVVVGVLGKVTLEVIYHVNARRNKKVWQDAYDKCGHEPIMGIRYYGGANEYYLPGDDAYENEKRNDYTGKYTVEGKAYYCTEAEAIQAHRTRPFGARTIQNEFDTKNIELDTDR